jgi:hypothetical protein
MRRGEGGGVEMCTVVRALRKKIHKNILIKNVLYICCRRMCRARCARESHASSSLGGGATVTSQYPTSPSRTGATGCACSRTTSISPPRGRSSGGGGVGLLRVGHLGGIPGQSLGSIWNTGRSA